MKAESPRERAHMTTHIDGRTRVYAILGDPIAQVKSPALVSNAFIARGENAVLVPLHVAPADFDTMVDALGRWQNFDGMVITVPHKFSAYRHCASATPRAAFLGAANVLRRRADGGWHGDQSDGLGCVAAMRQNGCDPAGRRALVIGAGGAGSAIAHALLEAGVSALSIHDSYSVRQAALLRKFADTGEDRVTPGAALPLGYDIVVNATPLGMRDDDPLPFNLQGLEARTFVADVVTAPEITPMIRAARDRGCPTSTGTQMYLGLLGLLMAFLRETGT